MPFLHDLRFECSFAVAGDINPDFADSIRCHRLWPDAVTHIRRLAARLGSVWSLVLFYAGLQVPFTTFLYVGFLRALPRDFEEAASIDGASPFKTFRYIVLPMLKPITVTALVLNAVAVWNDFFTPLLYLSGSDQQTVPVAVAGFVGQFVSDWNLIFAALLISIVPILAVYLALQRSIINGFAGGLKG